MRLSAGLSIHDAPGSGAPHPLRTRRLAPMPRRPGPAAAGCLDRPAPSILRQQQDAQVAQMPDVSAAAAQAFRECVARRREAGLPAEFWWRDDDLVGKSEKFRRLGQLSQQTGIVPLVSVIPAQADAGLGDLVRQFPQIVFCQHGYGHANHEPPARAEERVRRRARQGRGAGRHRRRPRADGRDFRA